MTYFVRRIAVCFCLVFVGIPSVSSAYDQNEATLYLWGLNIEGEASVGNISRPISVDFSSILDNLEMAFLGRYERRGDKWGGGIDVSYMSLEDDSGGFKARMDSTIAEAFATYYVNDQFNLIGGVRLYSSDLDLFLPAGTVRGESSVVDGFIGARARLPVSDKVGFQLRGDIGAGDSELVWNVVVGVDWRFADNWSAKLAYKWLDYEFEDVGKRAAIMDVDMRFEGPALAVSYYW